MDISKMMIYQKTIVKTIECTGIGLHSGEKVCLRLKPAEPNTGINFKRIDLSGQKVLIKASYKNLVAVNHATTLSQNGYHIQTVEHLLAAIAGLGIDNLLIEINAGEIPIMDGSAEPFIFLLQEAGIREQNALRTYLKIRKPLQVEAEDKYIKILPADELRITYTIDFQHDLIKTQQAEYTISESLFIKKISRARTFGFFNELQQLRTMGLIKGGSFNNAIVFGDDHILNGGLRFEDELVCHKMIDIIGDLSLIGCPIIGHIIAYKAGHGLHSLLAKELAKYLTKWEFIPSMAPIDLPAQAEKLILPCPSHQFAASTP